MQGARVVARPVADQVLRSSAWVVTALLAGMVGVQLLQGIGAVWALALLTDNYVRYGLGVNPGSLPRPDMVAALNAVVWVPAIGLRGTFLVLLHRTAGCRPHGGGRSRGRRQSRSWACC